MGRSRAATSKALALMAESKDQKPQKKRLTPKDIAAFDRAVALARAKKTRRAKRRKKGSKA